MQQLTSPIKMLKMIILDPYLVRYMAGSAIMTGRGSILPYFTTHSTFPLYQPQVYRIEL